MNLWIKYGPLMYTFSSRLIGPVQIKNEGVSEFSTKKKISRILLYIRQLIMSGFFIMLFLTITGYLNIHSFIFYFGLYIYLYITFLVFYEIGYIYNDVFSAKKEKNPTKYTGHDGNLKFRKINIIYRIILGCLLLLPIYFFNNNLFLGFSFILITMGISYTIHNLVRNYNVNIFTRTVLRICKIMIFIIVVLNLNLNDTVLVQKILEAYLIFNSLDFFGKFMLEYNKRTGGINSEDIHRYSYINTFFINIIFGIILKNPIFFIVCLRNLRGVIRSLIVLLKKYGLKSNR